MRHCGYWLSLRGQPETANVSQVTVQIPRSQIFSVTSLQHLMHQLGIGGVP